MSFISDHDLYARIVNRVTCALELLYDHYERILYSCLTTRADLAEVFTELWKHCLPLDVTLLESHPHTCHR